MSTTDLYAALLRHAEACDAHHDACGGAAYRHAAELLRGAVAAAVEEERESLAVEITDRGGAWIAESRAMYAEGRCDRGAELAAWSDAADQFADLVRARGESPRGDAASGGREAP